MSQKRCLASLFVVAVLFNLPHAAVSQEKESDERALVERACLDYAEAIYEVKPELIDRSVHKDLKKYGFWFNPRTEKYSASHMSFDQLRELASKWNKGGRVPEKSIIKEVKVLDLNDKTAAAKLTAVWGVDYFQLIKEDDKWMIYQIIWQSVPKKE